MTKNTDGKKKNKTAKAKPPEAGHAGLEKTPPPATSQALSEKVSVYEKELNI